MPGKKILVVDDEWHMLEMLKINLESEGYEVITAVNGEEALARAVDGSPDLISLDVNMPGLNGIDACKQLKAKPETKKIPVVMVSAYVQDADVARGLEAGAVTYIKKPINLLNYTTTIQQILAEPAK